MRIHIKRIEFLDADGELQKKLDYIARTYVEEFTSTKKSPATFQAQHRLLM